MSEIVLKFNQIDVYAELLFWLGFLFFNFTLFAFNYFINIREADFIPIKQLLTPKQRGVFVSPNHDFFRFSIDISILILLFRYGVLSSGFYLIASYYSFLFIFNIYHYSFNKIYQVSPIILNDFKLLKNAAGILWDESKFKMILSILILITTVIGLDIFLLNYLQFAQRLSTNIFTHTFSILLLIVFVTAIIRKGYKRWHEIYYRFLFLFLRLLLHVYDSIELKKTLNKYDKNTLNKSRRLKVNLRTKPNVYLLFIESYGSILVKHPRLSKIYNQMYNSFICSLKQSKWKCKNNLSASVSLIGPSWLAYSSVLLGHRVDTNFYYEHILRHESFNDFDTLIKILQKHGYHTYDLNASKFKNGIKVPIKQLKKLYGIDQYILTEDIAYKGTRYGFLESPPDQYVLNYTYKNYLHDNSKPFVLFYLTKNSHSPFITPKFIENWEDLNNTPNQLKGNNFLQEPGFDDYVKAIDYQVNFIQDFILKNGKQKDIFILLGDHQPHILSNLSDGTETIVHVISQDSQFLSEFEQYGFQDSIESLANPIKHEAIYSIFLRSFIKTYGEVNQEIPDYEPNGLQF